VVLARFDTLANLIPCICNPTATCGDAGEIWLEFGKRAMKLRITSHPPYPPGASAGRMDSARAAWQSVLICAAAADLHGGGGFPCYGFAKYTPNAR
jgi:hypothetical protein